MRDQLAVLDDPDLAGPALAPTPTPGKVPSTARIARVVMRQADPANGVAAGAERAIARAGGSSGAPLPDDVRGRFEQSLGADLSGVRVHTGADSADAAQAVGARAYATGNDIHFAAGQYAPADPFGLHLLAHEVAHTVQQSGSAPAPQYKLEVSTPDDPAELEADRAADAMVAGASASVSFGAGVHRKILRDPDPAADTNDKITDQDKETARGIQTKIRSIRTATGNARTTLNADAGLASVAVDATRAAFKDFEASYKAAVIRFTTGVKEAQAKRAEMDKALGIAADLALTAAGGAGGVVAEGKELFDVIRKAQDWTEKASQFLDAKGSAAPPPVPTAPAGAADWEGLLGSLSTAFKDYTKMNVSLTTIDAKCNDDQWVTSVANGTLKPVPPNLWETPEGAAAKKIGDSAERVTGQLQMITAGLLSTKPIAFQKEAEAAFKLKTPEVIERDVAIHWLAGLSSGDLKAINGAASYLKKLGLIDAEGNALGVDTGFLGGIFGPTKFEQQLILARAKVEQRARELVGQVVAWDNRSAILGYIIDPDDDSRYSASAPKEMPNGYQRVRVTGYAMRREEQYAAWKLADDGKHDPIGVVKSEVTFSVAPLQPPAPPPPAPTLE